MARDLVEALHDRLARRAVHLLPQPETAVKLRKVLGLPNHSARAIVDVLNGDPTVSAAVLRVANSAAYARGGPTTSLITAVARVGEKELSRVALASSLGAATSGPGPLLTVRRRLAQDAFASALICERLAQASGQDPELAFVAGLLHDVGSLVNLGTVELILAQHPGEPPRPEAGWREVAQVLHVEFGLLLARQWGLPEAVHPVIEHHHAAGEAPDPLTALVQAADALLELMHQGRDLREAQVPWLDSLALDARAQLVDSLAEVPSLVASLDAVNPAAPAASRAVSAAPRRAAPPKGPVWEGTVSGGRSGTVEPLTECRFLLKLKAPVVENHLAQLSLTLPDGPLSLWVRITGCTAYQIQGEWEATADLFSPTSIAKARIAAALSPKPLEAAA